MFDRKIYQKRWREEHKDYRKEYHHRYNQENKDRENKRKLEWCYKNLEHIKSYRKKWYQEHKEERREKGRLWYLKNKEQIIQQVMEWRRLNPDKTNLYQNKNKAKRKLLGKIDKHTIQMLYEDNIKKYGTLTCYLCNKSISFGEDSIDHIIPIAKNGTNDYENLSIVHRACNIKKNIKNVKEISRCLPPQAASILG